MVWHIPMKGFVLRKLLHVSAGLGVTSPSFLNMPLFYTARPPSTLGYWWADKASVGLV